MMSIMLAVLLGAMQGATPTSAAPQSPSEMANATKFDVTYDGDRVTACTITATSWNAQVDRYVCDAARFCGNHYKNANQRAACLATKREELSVLIAKAQGSGKSEK